jgi:uncharacterized lipoprotein
LADRAGFTVVSTDRANGVINIKMPQGVQPEKGFFDRLLSSDKSEVTDVVLKLKAKDKVTDVMVNGANEQTLTVEQKKSVFKRMGILE